MSGAKPKVSTTVVKKTIVTEVIETVTSGGTASGGGGNKPVKQHQQQKPKQQAQAAGQQQPKPDKQPKADKPPKPKQEPKPKAQGDGPKPNVSKDQKPKAPKAPQAPKPQAAKPQNDQKQQKTQSDKPKPKPSGDQKGLTFKQLMYPNIHLSDKMTAQRVADPTGNAKSIVYLNQPLAGGKRIGIKILESDRNMQSESFGFGVTTCKPNANHPLDSFCSTQSCGGINLLQRIFKASIPGTIVSFELDKSGFIQVVNNRSQFKIEDKKDTGIFKKPVYPMFILNGSVTKITIVDINHLWINPKVQPQLAQRMESMTMGDEVMRTGHRGGSFPGAPPPYSESTGKSIKIQLLMPDGKLYPKNYNTSDKLASVLEDVAYDFGVDVNKVILRLRKGHQFMVSDFMKTFGDLSLDETCVIQVEESDTKQSDECVLQ